MSTELAELATGLADHDDVIYHGTQPHGGGAGVITIEDRHGNELGVVRHLPKHSPTGMAWGYAGSGPADAARSLLIAALGSSAICCWCDAAGCERCDMGYIRLPYQAYKAEQLAAAPDEWRVTRAWLLVWLSRYDETHHDGEFAL